MFSNGVGIGEIQLEPELIDWIDIRGIVHKEYGINEPAPIREQVKLSFKEHDNGFISKIEYLKNRVDELEEECAKKQNKISNLEESYGRMKARVETWTDYILPRATVKAKEMIDNHHYASVQIVTTDYLEKLNEKQSNDKFTYGQPIEVAERIITTTVTREKTIMEKSLSKAFGNESDTVTEPMYSVPKIRQIAEHLLVYCNANEEVEQ